MTEQSSPSAASGEPTPGADPSGASGRCRVGLFVTCLVDLYRPNVGFAAVRLLEAAGFEVVVPEAQTCCGQPAWNVGDEPDTRAIARSVIEAFEGIEHVVVPSGSCAGMISAHYPELFGEGDPWRARAEELAARTHELLSFLTDVARAELPAAEYAGVATYHDGCSGLRELGVRDQPRALLGAVEGLELVEMEDTEVCCGFGGTFCVKYPDISERMVTDKVALAAATGADTLLGGDLGCLLNIAGRAARLEVPLEVRHAAEVLAGMTGAPPIGGAPVAVARERVAAARARAGAATADPHAPAAGADA